MIARRSDSCLGGGVGGVVGGLKGLAAMVYGYEVLRKGKRVSQRRFKAMTDQQELSPAAPWSLSD
jgi:hypothetical protein